MKRLLSLAALIALGATGATAQNRFALDLRAAVDAPAGKLADADLSTGVGFGSTLAVRVQPHLSVYGGWDWLHFTARQSFAGSDRDFEETGYTLGLRFEHPFANRARLAYRLEAGGTYKHVEIEDGGGDLLSNSGHSLGYEGGLGLVLSQGRGWRLTPTLRYRSLSPEFTIGSAKTSANLRYFGIDVGVSRTF